MTPYQQAIISKIEVHAQELLAETSQLLACLELKQVVSAGEFIGNMQYFVDEIKRLHTRLIEDARP